MNNIIEAVSLSKHYGSLCAVDEIDFYIPEACCFGLLGPNGAGKTTTVEMLEGITEPSSGEILFRGRKLDREYKQKIGIQFQSTALQEFLSVEETLKLFASMYKAPVPLAEVIASCDLEQFLQQEPRHLSGGQRQRVLLALALINDPQIVFLDEPTTGLDPNARRNFWNLIEHIKSLGKTVILTTHYMEEAYRLCDEIAIMNRGKIIARGSPENLLEEHFGEKILQLPRQDVPFLSDVQYKGNAMEIKTHDINASLRELLAHNVDLTGLKVRHWTLEDLFLRLTDKESVQ